MALGSFGIILVAGGLAWVIVGWPVIIGSAMLVAGVVIVGLSAKN
jgi:hypothetical protein